MTREALRRPGPRVARVRSLMLAALAGTLLGAPIATCAQSSGAAPRPPGTLAPTPTNPLDSGQGAVAGSIAPAAGATTTPGPLPSAASGPSADRVAAPPVVGTPRLEAALPALLPPPSQASAELPAALVPHPGGLTMEQVIERALRSDPGLRAAAAGIAAARAQRLEAGLQFLPSLNLSFRYTRISDYTASQIPVFDGINCVTNFSDCQANGQKYVTNYDLSPLILDQYALRGSITVPLSDIPLRLLRQYQAAGLTLEARRLDAEVTAAQTAQRACEALYEYLRAVGQQAVARQSLESADKRRDELRRSVTLGGAARADLLRAEATASDLSRLALLSRNSLALSEAQLRQRLHLSATEPLFLGEALDAPLPIPEDAEALIGEAVKSRPELASLSRQAEAMGLNRATLQATLLPSLSAQGNVDHANPNPRFFPQSADFNTSWDVSLQLSWSPSQAIVGTATMARLSAQRAQLLALLDQTREGIELEVRASLHAAVAARAQVDAARAQLAAAEEAHRVRSLRFSAGGATQAELRDVELERLRARLGIINAYVDLRLAYVRLQRSLGKRPDGGYARAAAAR